mgnify:CR=1 FL=1
MSAEKIGIQDGQLSVPDHVRIPYIEGDGVGVDITPAMQLVVEAAVSKAYDGSRSIEWVEILAGEKAKEKLGEYLPQETLEAIREHVVAIKGPLTTPVGGGIRSLNVAIRQALDLYSCVRPVKWYGQGSPIKRPELVDYVIWRENTDDVYIGIEWPSGSNEVLKVLNFLRNEMGVPPEKLPSDCSVGIKPASEYKSKRHVRKALRWALDNGRRVATLMHKGNIQKFTEGYFARWGYEVAEEPEFAGLVITEGELQERYKGDMERAKAEGYKLLLNDRIADNMFQQILTRTGDYDVIITMNLNGDYISDAAAGLVGGLGLAPGANIGDGYAVFEATHGTAPKYAGKDKVNPGSLILSAAFMLSYLGWREAAALIEEGLRRTLAERIGTYDLVREWKKEGIEGQEVSCSAFARAIVAHM